MFKGCGLWLRIQIWYFRITTSFYYMCCIYMGFFLLWFSEWCGTSSGKSGTSVGYQSFGCSVSGHLENICTDRRSQTFLWLDEFLLQTLWHLLSSLCLAPPLHPLLLNLMCVWEAANNRYNYEALSSDEVIYLFLQSLIFSLTGLIINTALLRLPFSLQGAMEHSMRA